MTLSLEWIAADGTVTSLASSEVSALLGADGLDIADVDNVWEPRASFDGSALTLSRTPVRSVMLPLLIQSDDTQAVLRSLVRSLRDGPGQLRATIGATIRTLREVVFESATDVRDGSNAVGGWRKIVVSLVAGDPWWYGSASAASLTLGASTAFDDASTAFDDAATPFNGGGTTLVTVDGDTSAFPFIVLDGPFTTLTIVNSTAGASLALADALGAGERMYIDGRPGSRGPRMDGLSTDWSLLTPASRLFSLQRGSNVLAVSSSGSTGASSVEVGWTDRHNTP